MIYLDANIFVFAFLESGNYGQSFRKILGMVEEQKIFASTSALTIDEVLWVLSKEIPKNEAISACKSILNIKGLKILVVDKNTISESLNIVENYNLKPRDAIHIAVMKINKIKEILSEDSDFDKIKEIKHYNLNEFMLKLKMN